MQKNNAVRWSHMLKAPGLLAVLVAAALTAGCGGPATVLHAVVDEAEERGETILDGLIENQAELAEAMEIEIPPCPEEYAPPPLSGRTGAYVDAVERPASLGDDSELGETLRTHRGVCEGKDLMLPTYQRMTVEMIPQLEDFPAYADAMRDFIDNEMTSEDVASLSAEIEAIAEARPAEEDTFGLRYDRLNRRIRESSPLVREMVRARRQGTQVRPGNFPAPGSEELADMIRPWIELMNVVEDANVFLTTWNDYQRHIHEGPDSENPEEAAGGWNAPTGVWTGEYNHTRSAAGRSPMEIRVTLAEDGTAELYWLYEDCGANFELTSTSGAANRLQEYQEATGGNCTRRNAQMSLHRTGENKMRFFWSGNFMQLGGNLTRD